MSILTKGGNHYISSGDILGRCPHCFNTSSVIKIGEISSNGTTTDTKKCTSCNRVFTSLDGGIQSLVEEITATDGVNVGFVSSASSASTTITSSSGSSGSSGSYNYNNNLNARISNLDDVERRIDTTNQKLGDMKYDLATIVQHMITLNQNLSMVINQNHTLMEKLAKDPLNGIRKAISEFNLK